jgi:hypothetical protein
LQVADVTGVQEIEDAVGEYDRLAGRAKASNERDSISDGHGRLNSTVDEKLHR